MILPLRDMANDREAANHVRPETFERLRRMVNAWGWEPMMTVTDDGGFRAWLRHRSGQRLFGAPADTAEAATLRLIAKVEPMAKGRGVR